MITRFHSYPPFLPFPHWGGIFYCHHYFFEFYKKSVDILSKMYYNNKCKEERGGREPPMIIQIIILMGIGIMIKELLEDIKNRVDDLDKEDNPEEKDN